MRTNLKKIASAAVTAIILAGCANPGYQQQGQPYPTQQSYPSSSSSRSYSTMYGVVDSVQLVQGSTNTGPGLGTVAGALVGGILGNQVGGGTGKAVATVAGAVGGGLVGNNLENRNRAAGNPMYQIGVRLDNGTYQTVTQESAADLGIGNRVRIENGRVYRY